MNASRQCQSAGTEPAPAGDGGIVALRLVAAIFLAAVALGAAPVDPKTSARVATDDYEPGEILALSADPWFIPHARKLGFALVDRVRLAALQLDVVRLRTPAAAGTREALRAFRTAFPSVTADFNARVRPAAEPREGGVSATTRWPAIHSTCGAGMRIGMIDTPVDVSHAAFRGRRIVHESFLTGDKRPASAAHGTAVASLLVGEPGSDGFGGLLPEAALFAANIFERKSWWRTRGDLFALLRALDWLAGERVEVINLSFEMGENTILFKALDKAANKGLVLTAPAGNQGPRGRPAYPAAHPRVLTATAVDSNLRAYRHANQGDYIDFAAPGVRLWTAVPGGGEFQSGTSFAVPFLTAAAALRLADGAQSELVRRALIRTARDLGTPGKDAVFGWGLIEFSPDCSRAAGPAGRNPVTDVSRPLRDVWNRGRAGSGTDTLRP